MKDSEATRDIHWPAGVCWMENIIEGIRNFKLRKIEKKFPQLTSLSKATPLSSAENNI